MQNGISIYTVTTRSYFPGMVALLNSLRLTGNTAEVVVLDAGMTPAQRHVLERHATIVTVPTDVVSDPVLAKPFAHTLNPRGIVLFIDSDVIVTGPLTDAIETARKGKIYAFTDPSETRWFPEWKQAFALSSVPRRQPYVSSGLVAFNVEDWPHLLERWWQACKRIPADGTLSAGARYSDPLSNGDQDALNAILMTEVPRDALVQRRRIPRRFARWPTDLLLHVHVVDPTNLACTLNGEPVDHLHYEGNPKPWMPRSWMRIRHNAYVRLLPRVLFQEDVPLRLMPSDVSLWLRPGLPGELVLAALTALNASTRTVARRAPRRAYVRLTKLAARLGRR
jgi:hypothetical protein